MNQNFLPRFSRHALSTLLSHASSETKWHLYACRLIVIPFIGDYFLF